MKEVAVNAQTFNALMNQQVPRLTLHQRELLKKRLDELDDQQKRAGRHRVVQRD